MAELEIEETEQDDFEVLPLNKTYLVEVQSYDIVDSTFKDKQGNFRKDLKWSLRVLKPEEFYDRVLVFWTPFRLSRHKKTGEANKTLRFLEYLGFDYTDKDSKKVNLDNFVGKKINITLKNKFGVGGRTFQKVDNFFPSVEKR